MSDLAHLGYQIRDLQDFRRRRAREDHVQHRQLIPEPVYTMVKRFFVFLVALTRVIPAFVFLPRHFRIEFAAARLDQSTMPRTFDIS